MKQEKIDDPVVVVPRPKSQSAGVTAANQDSRSNVNNSREPSPAAAGWWCLDCEAAAGEHCWADHALMSLRGALRRRLHVAILSVADQLKAVEEDVHRLGREEHVAAALQVLSGASATCHLTMAVDGGDTLSGSWRLPGGDYGDAGASLQRLFLALLAARGRIATEEVVFLGTRPPPRAAVPASTTRRQTASELGLALESAASAPTHVALAAGTAGADGAGRRSSRIASQPTLLHCDAEEADGPGLGGEVAPKKRKRGSCVDASREYAAGAEQMSGRPPAKKPARKAAKKKAVGAAMTGLASAGSSRNADGSEVPGEGVGWCTVPSCRAEMSSWERFVEHLKMDHGVPKYFCNLCLSGFKTDNLLRQHQSKHGKRFNCQHCKAQFVRLRALNGHVARFHLQS